MTSTYALYLKEERVKTVLMLIWTQNVT